MKIIPKEKVVYFKSLRISIKHSGIIYNPKTDTDLNYDNIDMLLNISDNIDHSQI